MRHMHTHMYTQINRSIRLIYRLNRNNYSTSITELRQRLNWMMTTDSIDYNLLTKLKKTLTYEQPHALRLPLNIKSNNGQLRTSDQTNRLNNDCLLPYHQAVSSAS